MHSHCAVFKRQKEKRGKSRQVPGYPGVHLPGEKEGLLRRVTHGWRAEYRGGAQVFTGYR
eukprot:1456787-Rhodomonas_salina.1